MLPRRWSGRCCVYAGLLAAVSLQPGCVVRDRVVIVPWDWSDPPAQAETSPDPQRPGGRVGTNAVLPTPPEPVPETTEPAVEPMPEAGPDAVAQVEADADTSAEPEVMPGTDSPAEDDAVAQGGAETDAPDPPTTEEPAPTVEPGPAAPAVAELDPPLHAAWAEGSAYNRRYIAGSDPATATGEIESVGTFVPAEGASPGLLLTLGSGDAAVAVHVAPLRYLRAVDLRFDFGEPLTVTGRWVNLDGRRVLFAQSITRGEAEIEVRDAQTGRPVWVDPIPSEGGDDAEDPPDGPEDRATGDSPTA